MGKLIPIILALAGLGAGTGAGLFLRPQAAAPQEPHASDTAPKAETGDEPMATPDLATAPVPDFVKLNNQFVVPVIKDGSVSALVVLALSLELRSGGAELVYQREPKLRDAFLQVLFNHANTGGFDGNFTSGRNMGLLRNALLESAQKILGNAVAKVLIVDVVRQDT
jgi:hypothetical protein